MAQMLCLKTASGFTNRDDCTAYMELYPERPGSDEKEKQESYKNRKDFLNLLKRMDRLVAVKEGSKVVVLWQERCPGCRPPGGPGCHKVQPLDSDTVFYAVGFELEKCKRE